ncbi:variable surface protein [Plasmodium gonderi]|uniref:Variable surface protein n=1 Tax=Plasmodium gonderi TaxID=77519 RepID=A0A1Y1JU72_PLAGO|nr:variable surface protein [Plasmodium gonderi]GAW83953.1 variable surface protein [Plasmodium gonderi]
MKYVNFSILHIKSKLLNYWIYNRLSWLYHGKPDPITDTFAKLQLLWNSLVGNSIYTSFYNKCSLKFEIIYQHNSIKRKELYNYCIDYITLLNTPKYYKDMRDIICEYFKRKTKLYEGFKAYYSEQNNHECPEFFIKCNESSPYEALSQINNYIEAEKRISENSAVQRKKTISVHTRSESETSSEGQSGAIDSKAFDNHDISLDGPALEDNSLLTIYGTEQFTDLFINLERSSIVSIWGKTFLGLILFTVLSSILYKFTTMEIHLRKIFGQRKNIISDINKRKNILFDYSSESYNQNYMNEEEHFIEYHSG